MIDPQVKRQLALILQVVAKASWTFLRRGLIVGIVYCIFSIALLPLVHFAYTKAFSWAFLLGPPLGLIDAQYRPFYYFFSLICVPMISAPFLVRKKVMYFAMVVGIFLWFLFGMGIYGVGV